MNTTDDDARSHFSSDAKDKGKKENWSQLSPLDPCTDAAAAKGDAHNKSAAAAAAALLPLFMVSSHAGPMI